MFTYLKLKNFMSFKDITINLESKKNEPKKVVIIYGQNGSGKSTITKAFSVLKRTIQTMQVRDMLSDILDDKFIPPEDIPLKPEIVLDMLKSRLSNNTIEKVISNYKMIGSKESMSLEYGFNINGNIGSYYIEMDDDSIIEERLEYKLNKKKSCYFEINKNLKMINQKIFKSDEMLNDIKQQVKMYWGKHSFLSIILYEVTEKSESYVRSNIIENLLEVINQFGKINYKIRKAHNDENSSIDTDDYLLENLEYGVIDINQKEELAVVEKVLNNFLKSLFDDVKKAFYKTNVEKEKITYSLWLTKKIENLEYDIDFEKESTGTQEILELLPYLMLAASGKCVIIDEYGIGIHDLLAAQLIKSVSQHLKGQLIITTHNTLIMDQSDIPAESLYFIMDDKKLNKSVKCVTDLEERLHPNYNYRKRYFTKDIYGEALPKINIDIDLEEFSKLYS